LIHKRPIFCRATAPTFNVAHIAFPLKHDQAAES
jgi:hypothetical protein